MKKQDSQSSTSSIYSDSSISASDVSVDEHVNNDYTKGFEECKHNPFYMITLAVRKQNSRAVRKQRDHKNKHLTAEKRSKMVTPRKCFEYAQHPVIDQVESVKSPLNKFVPSLSTDKKIKKVEPPVPFDLVKIKKTFKSS